MKKTVLVLAVLASAALATQAAVFSEPFDYADGEILANSDGVWIYNTGTSCFTSNQVLRIWNNISPFSEDIAHVFQPGFTNIYPNINLPVTGTTSNLYARFTALWTGNNMPGAVGTYFFGFAAEQISFYRARVEACTSNFTTTALAPAGFFYLSIGNNSPSGSTPFPPPSGQLAATFTTNVLYTIVAKICLTNALSTVWVGTNPATMLETDTSATANDFVDPTNFTCINSVNFRQAAGEGTILIDNLKVGLTWDDIFRAPDITAVANQAIPASTNTGPLDFAVDSQIGNAATSITITTSSSNPTLVPNSPANIQLGSDVSGTNRTVKVTPAAGQQGSATITLTAHDGTATSSTSFTVTVGAPVISTIPNQIFFTNTPIPVIPFSVTDAESDPVTVTVVSSSNTNLIKTANVVLGGTGSSRTITLTPQAGVLGISTITLSATDGHTPVTTSFTLTMAPKLGLLYNEDFRYTGFSVPNSLYQATGGSGAPWNHISGTVLGELQVTNFPPTNGYATLVYTNNEDLGASLSITNNGSNGVVLYASFTAQWYVSPSTLGEYFFHLSDSGVDTANFRGKVFANHQNAAPGKFRLAVANQSSTPTAEFPADLRLNTRYTVVMRYNSGSGETVLWVNPYSTASTSVTAVDNFGKVTIGGVGLRQPGSGIGIVDIGPIKVGTSFTDVFPPLDIVAPVNPLAISVSGGNATLTWSYPFMLTTASSINGPWSEVAGATTGYSTAASGTAQYFRLAY